MKKIKLLFMFFLLFSLSACNGDISLDRHSVYADSYLDAWDEVDNLLSVEPFGTYFALVGYNKNKVNQLQPVYSEEIERLNALFDSYYYYTDENKDESEIDRGSYDPLDKSEYVRNVRIININYGSPEATVVEEDLFNVIKAGIDFTIYSKGKFNIAIGALVSLWEESIKTDGSSYGIDPSENDIEEALACVPNYLDIENVIELNEEESSVKLNALDGCNGSASINLGAIGKGYALDYISKLPEFSSDAYILDGGSSSIITINSKPDGNDWSIVVPVSSNYDTSNKMIFDIRSSDGMAVSTSGGDVNYYMNDENVLRHHIIDAISGYPKNYYYSVTVVSDNAMYSDAITTALMSMNIEEIKEFITSLNKVGIQFGLLLQKANDDGTLSIVTNQYMRNYQGSVATNDYIYVDINNAI